MYMYMYIICTCALVHYLEVLCTVHVYTCICALFVLYVHVHMYTTFTSAHINLIPLHETGLTPVLPDTSTSHDVKTCDMYNRHSYNNNNTIIMIIPNYEFIMSLVCI